MKIARPFLIAASLLLAAGCDDRISGPPDTEPVSFVMVEPDTVGLLVGQTRRLTARAHARDGAVLYGRGVAWLSSDTATARIDAAGNVTARNAGTATLSATAEGKTGRALLRVQAPVLPVAVVQIRPSSETITLAPGASLQLEAVLLAADGTELSGRPVVWSSDRESVATVSGDGRLEAQAVGTAIVTATSEGKADAATVRVQLAAQPVARIELRPSGGITIRAGSSRQLEVRAFAADGTELFGRPVTWTSTDAAVVRVTDANVLVALAKGIAGVTANVEGRQASLGVEVESQVARVEMDPPAAVLAVGDIANISAVPRDENGVLLGFAVTWTSSNPAVATVNAWGRVSTVGAGNATITAWSDGVPGRTTIIVANWLEHALLTVGGSAPPVTLHTFTRTDNTGATRTVRLEVRAGTLRVLPGGPQGGRYEQRFDVWIYQDGTVMGAAGYIFPGSYTRDPANGALVFHPVNGTALGGTRLPGGGVTITGSLLIHPDQATAELTFVYAVQ